MNKKDAAFYFVFILIIALALFLRFYHLDERVFHHDEATAKEITLKIHNEGTGIAGIYTFEIAEQKIADATNLARQHGFPLVLKAEAE